LNSGAGVNASFATRKMDVVKAKAWKDFLSKNPITPPAFDRLLKDSENQSPFCVGVKTVEGINPKVSLAFLFLTDSDCSVV